MARSFVAFVVLGRLKDIEVHCTIPMVVKFGVGNPIVVRVVKAEASSHLPYRHQSHHHLHIHLEEAYLVGAH
jgi:hypothetical protein